MNGLSLRLAVAALVSVSGSAWACGCFAPPDVSTPVVQAGERILFSVDQGTVTAHVQIQYQGDAANFGWLLPLPAVPTLELGSDVLFTQLERVTQPTYVLSYTFQCARSGGGFTLGCGAPRAAPGNVDGTVPPSTPLVVRSSVGPYDYAVLDASDPQAMLTWLADNHFYVPTGTNDVLAPYTAPGMYFLALKLRSGASAGDIAPVVIRYPGDHPMIPLILTSVTAVPNMGIEVFLLGEGRGIPRNYRHVVLDDALLDWRNGVQNYAQVVTAAVGEAPDRHAFVTEYAGTSSVMHDVLSDDARFGAEAGLASMQTPALFISYLDQNRFGLDDPTQGVAYPPALLRPLLDAFPKAEGFTGTDVEWLHQLDDSGFTFSMTGADGGVEPDGGVPGVDEAALAHRIFTEYVAPLRAANELFAKERVLTRLFTTLSPEDMTADPVFGFSTTLPTVSNQHDGTFDGTCHNVLTTEQGASFELSGTAPPPLGSMPAARRIEVLSEEGAPVVEVDNAAVISAALQNEGEPQQRGCSSVDAFSMSALGLLVALRSRRRR